MILFISLDLHLIKIENSNDWERAMFYLLGARTASTSRRTGTKWFNDRRKLFLLPQISPRAFLEACELGRGIRGCIRPNCSLLFTGKMFAIGQMLPHYHTTQHTQTKQAKVSPGLGLIDIPGSLSFPFSSHVHTHKETKKTVTVHTTFP